MWSKLVLLLPDLTWCSCMLYLVLAITAVALYQYYTTSRAISWSQYGVICPKLSKMYFITGDFRTRMSDLLKQHGDTVGIQTRGRLGLLTTNLDILRNVLVKDFNKFQDRGGFLLTSTPLRRALFFATGNTWRRNRQIVSPTFTSGKLKFISDSVKRSAEDLSRHLEVFAKKNEVVPMKEVCGQYTCEIIANTAFGLDVRCIGQQDEFYSYARNLLYSSRRLISQLIRMIPVLPDFTVKVLGLQLCDRINLKSAQYFDAVLKETIAERKERNKVGGRKNQQDFLDLLLRANEAASEGRVDLDDDVKDVTSGEGWNRPVKALTNEEMLGHSMLFIFAGHETTATTLHMCLYELALNPDIQEKVYQEIVDVLTTKDSFGQEELNKLSYLEQVINETLRLYAPIPSINRLALETVTYRDITIPKGATVIIPLFHILTDPQLYPEPDRFDPDRFSSEEKEKRDPLAFMPFGQGPRMCLGMRLAYLELKQALVQVLRRLRVVLNQETVPKKGEARIETVAMEVLAPATPIKLAFELRHEKGQ